MIPMELISMLGSTVLGGVMSIMAQKGQAEAEREKMLLQILLVRAFSSPHSMISNVPYLRYRRQQQECLRYVAALCKVAGSQLTSRRLGKPNYESVLQQIGLHRGAMYTRCIDSNLESGRYISRQDGLVGFSLYSLRYGTVGTVVQHEHGLDIVRMLIDFRQP